MMVINFIKENWRLIVEVVVLIASVVMFIVRKKPVKVVDTLKEIIVRILPALINLAEIQDGLKGEDKALFVLQKVKEALLDLGYGDDVVNQYLPFASEQLEIILTTPQKKVR